MKEITFEENETIPVNKESRTLLAKKFCANFLHQDYLLPRNRSKIFCIMIICFKVIKNVTVLNFINSTKLVIIIRKV